MAARPRRDHLVGSSNWHTFRLTATHDFLHAGGFLVVGGLTAAVLNVAVPRSWLDGLASHEALAVVAMAALAVVLSICSEADAFVAASLSEFSLTSRLVFLVVGPMVDLKLVAIQSGTFSAAFARRFAPRRRWSWRDGGGARGIDALMGREVPAVLLLIVGGALLRITVGGSYLNYVQESSRPYLLATAGVLLLLGLLALVDVLRNRSRDVHAPRSAWLLLLPVLAVFLIAQARSAPTAPRGRPRWWPRHQPAGRARRRCPRATGCHRARRVRDPGGLGRRQHVARPRCAAGRVRHARPAGAGSHADVGVVLRRGCCSHEGQAGRRVGA